MQARNRQIDNLVLGGGVLRGLAHLGMINALEKAGIMQNVKRIAGSSIGALMAVLPALNTSPNDRLDYLINKISIPKFQDSDFFNPNEYLSLRSSAKDPFTPVCKLFYNVIKFNSLFIRAYKSGGICNGNYIEEVVNLIIKNQTGKSSLTFKELHELAQSNPNFKDLYVTSVNRDNNRLEIFSHETTPDMSIALAVHASIAVPLFYKNVVYNNKHYIDGCIYGGMVMNLFDDEKYLPPGAKLVNGLNMRTLGVCLATSTQIARVRDNQLVNYNRSIFTFFAISTFVVQDEYQRRSFDPLRILFLNIDHINPINFYIKPDQIKKIIAIAEEETQLYVENYIENVSDPTLEAGSNVRITLPVN